MQVLIGIDDTDNLDSIGTGRLSRMLAEALEHEGLIGAHHVTRHQFLVHDAIPYTSHNSSACIAAQSRAPLEKLLDAGRAFLVAHEHAGANPGLYVAAREAVPAALVELGRRAQIEVLELAPVQTLVRSLGVLGWWAGETGQGIIGALGGAGLRSTGEDGRFIELRGIRDLSGVLGAGEIIARSAIVRVLDDSGAPLANDAPVDTRGWVRPMLRGDQPVLVVTRDGDCWAPAEKKRKD